jgi:catechol 2,3-dioxygenase-like lactoylglutathione lyase family enzyme
MSHWPAVQHLSFPVRDVGRAAAFYRDFLGFSALREPDEHIAELAMGATKLVLLRGEPDAPKDLHFGFAEATRSLVGEWARKAREAGVTIESGPEATEWGGYVLYLRDPDGHLIELWSGH